MFEAIRGATDRAIILTLLGAVAGALALSAACAGVFYAKGRADQHKANLAAENSALKQQAETDRAALAGAVVEIRGLLAADRAYRIEDARAVAAALDRATGAAEQAMERFNADFSCPAEPDDVRVYNEAFGLVPGAGDRDRDPDGDRTGRDPAR